MTEIDNHFATGYDLFISLMVLHEPERFGLRGAWAAGIRARIPDAERAFLETFAPFVLPAPWVYRLPAPRDAAAVLDGLAAIPPARRLPVLFPADDDEGGSVLLRIARQGRWQDADFEEAAAAVAAKPARSRQLLAPFLDAWTQPAESGSLLLSALRAYQDAFFAEEEKRIRPWLEEATAHTRELCAQLPVPALLDRLSDGVHLDTPLPRRLALAPSFWSAPLVVAQHLAPAHLLFLYGARPAHISLVPGAPVPDDLMRTLKALADPTRLRILRYLQREPENPAGLARRLRLRAPTVVHHLDVLRMARLVHVTMEQEGRRHYTLRPDAIDRLMTALDAFITAEADPTVRSSE